MPMKSYSTRSVKVVLFSSYSIVGIDIGPNDNNADEITSRRKRISLSTASAATAMPIIEQCLRNRLNRVCSSKLRIIPSAI